MEPVKYLRIIRRQWRLIAGLTFFAFVLGFVTTPEPSVTTTSSGDVFLATHTLLSSSTESIFTLDQMAYFVTSGDVSTEVGKQLGADPVAVTRQVSATASQQLGTLEINAFDADPDRAVLIANTFAQTLLGYLDVVSKQYVDEQRAQLQLRLDELTAQIAAMDNPPAGSDPNLMESQRAAAQAEYQSVSASMRELDTKASSKTVFSLNAATAVPVSPDQLQARLTSTGQKVGGRLDSSETVDVSQAKLPKKQSPLLRGLMGAMAGLFISVTFAMVFARLDPRIHTKEQAEEAFGVPVIAELPRLTRSQQKDTEVFSFAQPTSRTAEAFRSLRSSIMFLGLAHNDPVTQILDGSDSERSQGVGSKKVVLVTSPGPAEGKTTTVANLAAIVAEAGMSVLVVNCDFRKPRVHAYLGGDASERRVVESPVPGVWVLNHVVHPGETSNPASIIAAQRDVATRARSMFDVVLLDTAPLLTTNDASELLGDVDVVLVVARAAKTTYEAADRAMEILERFDAPVVGVALTSANETPSNRYYYYYQSDEVPLMPGMEGDTSAKEDAVMDLGGPLADNKNVSAKNVSAKNVDVESAEAKSDDTGDSTEILGAAETPDGIEISDATEVAKDAAAGSSDRGRSEGKSVDPAAPDHKSNSRSVLVKTSSGASTDAPRSEKSVGVATDVVSSDAKGAEDDAG